MWQQDAVRELAGKYPVKELAEKINASRSNVKRYAASIKLSLDSLSYKPEVIERVCRYYEKHGKIKTQEKFPDLRVRSIIERHRLFKPRQRRWTAEEHLECIRMAGLISYKRQARFFNRPNANGGSIKSFYAKRLEVPSAYINGLPIHVAKYFVKEGCEAYKTGYGTGKFTRYIALWVDVEKYLKDEVPEHIREGVKALASFQRWLHKDDVHQQIERILRER